VVNGVKSLLEIDKDTTGKLTFVKLLSNTLNMTEKWRKSLDENLFVAAFFLDFRKVFDSLNHKVIEKNLMACGYW